MPTENNQSTSSNEPTGFALSYQSNLNITEGVEFITNQLILGQNVTLDLFGGKTSQIPEAINVDLIAESGIKASIAELLPKLPRQSIDQIIVSNPQAYFLEYAAPVLKPGGRIYINATRRNPLDLSHNSNPQPRLVSGVAPLKGRSSRNQRFNKGFNGRAIKTAQFYDRNFTVFFQFVGTFIDT